MPQTRGTYIQNITALLAQREYGESPFWLRLPISVQTRARAARL